MWTCSSGVSEDCLVREPCSAPKHIDGQGVCEPCYYELAPEHEQPADLPYAVTD